MNIFVLMLFVYFIHSSGIRCTQQRSTGWDLGNDGTLFSHAHTLHEQKVVLHLQELGIWNFQLTVVQCQYSSNEYVLVYNYLFTFSSLCPLSCSVFLQTEPWNPVTVARLSHSQILHVPWTCMMFLYILLILWHKKVQNISHYQNILPAMREISPVCIIWIIIIFSNYTAVLQTASQMTECF